MTKGRVGICDWCSEPFTAAARGRMPTYCSNTHRNQAYNQRRDKKTQTAVVDLTAQIEALRSAADLTAVIGPLNQLRLLVGLDPIAAPSPERPPRVSNRSKHPWAVRRSLIEDSTQSVVYSTHTTRKAAETATRRLSRIWVAHQRRSEAERWIWHVEKHDGKLGLKRADADAAARRLIVPELAPLSNDPRDQVIVRRATQLPQRWEIGTLLKINKSDRLLPLQTGGISIWEISHPNSDDWQNRHPYVYELVDAATGLAMRGDRAAASTTRRDIAEQLATELLDPAGDSWELVIVELRAWLDDHGYINQSFSNERMTGADGVPGA